MSWNEDEAPPVLVEVLRGETVESLHRGAFAVVDASGRVVHAAGRISVPVFHRSAVKPFQALPLIESGAAAALGFTARHIALACASHRGEAGHVEAARGRLAAASLDVSDLECGPHVPGAPAAAADLIRRGEAPTALHNNCSGKHTGFLCTAVHLGDETRGYIDAGHPVQRRVTAALAEMTGAALDEAPCGCDGCGIPTFAIPLRGVAQGMARMVDTASLGPIRGRAAGIILDAMAAEPFFVEGMDSFVTRCMEVAGETVRLKMGAEGVYAAALPRLGYGIALKIEDGNGRAAEVAIAGLLSSLGCFDAEQRVALAEFIAPVIKNAVGRPVGALRATTALGLV
jgi:L-asparaginase II